MPSSFFSEICYVLMPFGPKANPFPGPRSQIEIDFDNIYNCLIAPAISNAGLQPFRADKEMTSGLILPAMFERLLLCPYAVADLTTANPNVYYELGIRHAVRPRSTILLYGSTARLPFDVQDQWAQKYTIDADGSLTNAQTAINRLTDLLNSVRQTQVSGRMADDSPLFTLLRQRGYEGPDLTKVRSQMQQIIDNCVEVWVPEILSRSFQIF